MNKKKATCADIKEIVKVLKEHEIKPDKDGLITIEYPINTSDRFYIIDGKSPFYRDSVGMEELDEDTR